MRGAGRRHVARVRSKWSETTGVALKIGKVNTVDQALAKLDEQGGARAELAQTIRELAA